VKNNFTINKQARQLKNSKQKQYIEKIKYVDRTLLELLTNTKYALTKNYFFFLFSSCFFFLFLFSSSSSLFYFFSFLFFFYFFFFLFSFFFYFCFFFKKKLKNEQYREQCREQYPVNSNEGKKKYRMHNYIMTQTFALNTY